MERERRFHKTRGRILGFLIILGSALIALLTGCGETPAEKKENSRLRIGLMITPKGLNDKGFNDLALAGLLSASKKHNVEAVVIEPATTKDPEASLRFFTAQKFDAIIAVGLAFYESIKIIAKEKPGMQFFVIDSSMNEGAIKGVSFREDEGSFLCGFLASRMSRSGKVGFIGGVKIEVIKRFAEGFRLGAAYGASATQVIEKYVAEDFSGFNRPEIARGLANELYKDGCDVIYHAAGASGLGAIAAAVDAKKYVIGVDMNQDALAPGLVLTSMLKKVDLVVENVVRSLVEGKNADTLQRSFGLADGAIDLTDFQLTQAVLGTDLIKQVGELKKAIINGQVKTSGSETTSTPAATGTNGGSSSGASTSIGAPGPDSSVSPAPAASGSATAPR